MSSLSALTRTVARALVYRAPLETDHCPACASTRLTDVDLFELKHPIQGRRHGLVTLCETCGLVFTNPLPTAEDQSRFYSPEGDWGSRRVESHGDSQPVAPSGGSWSRIFDPIRDACPVLTPPPGARVLDFGCGEGKLLDHMQDAGWDTYGIEPSFDRAFARHHRLDAILTEPTFDVIVANHVLEHVTNPLDILRALAAAAKPGGYLVVGVPRLDTLPDHHDYKYVVNGSAHVTAYTWPCLQGLLARAGWDAVAPPPESVSAGKRGRTVARMRVVSQRSRRAAAPLELPPGAADVARVAIDTHLRSLANRSWLLRGGHFRLVAQLRESRRRVKRGAGAVRGRLRLRSRIGALLGR